MRIQGLVAGLLTGLFLGLWFSYDVQPAIVRQVFDRPGYVAHVIQALPSVGADSVPRGREYVRKFGLEQTIRRRSVSDQVVEQLARPFIRRVVGRLLLCLPIGGLSGAVIGFYLGGILASRRGLRARRR